MIIHEKIPFHNKFPHNLFIFTQMFKMNYNNNGCIFVTTPFHSIILQMFSITL